MPAVSSCPGSRVLHQLVSGQLPAAEVEFVERHLEQCGTCGEALEQLVAQQTLAESSGGQPPSAAASRLVHRLRGSQPDTASSHQEATDDSLPSVDPSAGASGTDFELGPAAEAGSRFDETAASFSVATGGSQSSKNQPAASMDNKPASSPTGPLDFLGAPQGPNELGRIAHYVILKALGKGGMGIVFKAEDTHLQRPVALKVMLPEIAKDESARQRFLREARAAAKIKNDHIVTIYQVGQDNTIPFLAMEFLEGHPLDQWLAQGNQPTVAQVLRIGREVAKGLAAAHDQGLVHRDIKPGNIWLEAPNGRIKILDFGLARAVNDDIQLTRSGLIVGTPAYMSPEQAGGEEIDHRCDLFSLGCVLYRLCSGELPFTGSSTIAVLKALALHNPKPLREINPAIPATLADLVTRLLAKKPEQRPASAHAVADAIEAIERNLTAMGAATASQPLPQNIRVDATRDRPSQAPLKSQSVIRHHSGVHRSSSRRRSSLSKGTIALAVVLLLAGAGLAYFLVQQIQTSKGTVEVASENPKEVQVFIEQNGQPVKILYQREQKQQVDIDVGNYHVRLGEGGQGWLPEPSDFTLTHETKAVLTIKRDTGQRAGKAKPLDDDWLKRVAEMPAQAQVAAVAKELKERNPGFGGELNPEIDNARVTGLGFDTEKVSDILPLKALPHLKQLMVHSPGGAGKLADLAPLGGMQLAMLDCGGNRIQDLTPLRGMPLKTLFLGENPVRDLSPLRSCPIEWLICQSPYVEDFAPLKDMPLKNVIVSNLKSDQAADALRSVKTLEKINGEAASGFVQEHGVKRK
jgi:serine/threonine protein kinase